MIIPRQNLRTPGPTPCPDEVLEAMGLPMINHRGPEFAELIVRLTDKMKRVFMTEKPSVHFDGFRHRGTGSSSR